MPRIAVVSTTCPLPTAECHTATGDKPKLPVPNAEGVLKMEECLIALICNAAPVVAVRWLSWITTTMWASSPRKQLAITGFQLCSH